MPKKNRKGTRKKSVLGNTIPTKYASFPPMLARWTTEVDNYARKKGRKEPRALRHHYE